MEFEWDETKRLANVAKHGIDFKEAEELFSGPMVVRVDKKQDYGEARLIGFGLVNNRLITVAYVLREEKIRIISMRKGNSREKARYEREITNRLGQAGRNEG